MSEREERKKDVAEKNVTESEVTDDESDSSSTKSDMFEDMCNNPQDYYSPKELFDEIETYDATVEIVGLVHNFTRPDYVNKKEGGKLLRFKFVVTDEKYWNAQVTVFGEELIEKVQCFIKQNHVIHLDGLLAKDRFIKCSEGNINHDFIFRDNTVLNVVGKRKEKNTLIKALTVSIEECVNHNRKIGIEK